MAKRLINKRFMIIVICSAILVSGLIIFARPGRQTPSESVLSESPANYHEELPIAGTIEAHVANLHKLCKIWGFAKYTHMAFLTGERCWDEELLNLIPIVKLADPEDVNDILYNWYAGLGDDGFDNNGSVFLTAHLDDILHDNLDEDELFRLLADTDWISIIGSRSYGFTVLSLGLRVDRDQLEALDYDDEFLGWLHSLEPVGEEYMRFLADLSWLTDESFSGHSLAAAFSRFREIPITDRANGPVPFDNQSLHASMDFADAGYRLLGLFRLWNAMKYFFPYLDIIDDDWNWLLIEHIPRMLEGTDMLSYELTLASLASRLHDVHVVFRRTGDRSAIDPFLDDRFGRFVAPAMLTEAEGQIVVAHNIFEADHDQRLLPGDVVLMVNGAGVDEIISAMRPYVSLPNEEKALFWLAYFHMPLRQNSSDIPMELVVFRDGMEVTVHERTVNSQTLRQHRTRTPAGAYERLENNIGFINASGLRRGNSRHIMAYFADTSGLIIDLRHRPDMLAMLQLAEYLVAEAALYARHITPSQSIPGVFIDFGRQYAGGFGGMCAYAYTYEENVVILMDERSWSLTEHMIMALRNGSNVTVMGSNSIGSNGEARFLPLPGDISMGFTTMGMFTSEGGQTQRIGLSPDIHVPRTMAGIRDGRDELLEAAVQYLMGSSSLR